MAAICQQMGIDAQLVYAALDELGVDQEISYEELSRLISRDIQQHRGVLATARRNLLKNNKVFAVIPTVGLKRVDDRSKVLMAAHELSRIRAISRKSSKILAAVADFAGLPNDLKLRHNATMSICGALLECASAKSVRRIEKTLANTNGSTLPVAETLKQLME